MLNLSNNVISTHWIKLGEEKIMVTLFRISVLKVSLFLIISFLPQNVIAQPFGMLSQQDRHESQKQVLSSSGGRFVFGQVSDSAKDQFMLDTYTGRLWKISERGDIGTFLKSIPYSNSDGKLSHVPEKLPDSANEKTTKK
jgi:hypothetical protein